MTKSVYQTPTEIRIPARPGQKPAPAWQMAAMRRCLGVLATLPEPRRDNAFSVFRLLMTNLFSQAEYRSLEERDELISLIVDTVRADLATFDRMLADVIL